MFADGNLAELAGQLGNMVDHPKTKSMQPRPQRRCPILHLNRRVVANLSSALRRYVSMRREISAERELFSEMKQ